MNVRLRNHTLNFTKPVTLAIALLTFSACGGFSQKLIRSSDGTHTELSGRSRLDAVQMYHQYRKTQRPERFSLLNPKDFFSQNLKNPAARRTHDFMLNVLDLRDRNRASYQQLRDLVFEDFPVLRDPEQLRSDELVFFRMLFEDPISWNYYLGQVSGLHTTDRTLIGPPDRRFETALAPLLTRLSQPVRASADRILFQKYATASKITEQRRFPGGPFERNHEGMGPKRIFDTYYRLAHVPDRWLLHRYSELKKAANRTLLPTDAQMVMGQAYEELVALTRQKHGLAEAEGLSKASGTIGSRMADYDLRTFYRLLDGLQQGLRQAESDRSATGVSLLFGGSMARGTATLQTSEIDGYLKTGNRRYFAERGLNLSRRLEDRLTKAARAAVVPFLGRDVAANLGSDAMRIGDDKSHPSAFVRNLDEVNLGRINPIAFEVTPDEICLVVYSVPLRPASASDLESPTIRVFRLQHFVTSRLGEKDGKEQADSRVGRNDHIDCHTAPTQVRE